MAKKSKQKSTGISELQRHLLTGAAFGLYFGWFFRPQREASFVFAIFLAVILTIVMLLYRLYQNGRENAQATFKEAPLNFGQFLIFWTALEFRHFAYDFGSPMTSNPVIGGRLASAVLMIFVGVLLGGIYYWRNSQK